VDFVDVDCGRAVIRVESTLAAMSRPRVHLSAFEVPAGREPELVVARHDTLPDTALVAEGPLGRCRYLLDSTRFDV